MSASAIFTFEFLGRANSDFGGFPDAGPGDLHCPAGSRKPEPTGFGIRSPEAVLGLKVDGTDSCPSMAFLIVRTWKDSGTDLRVKYTRVACDRVLCCMICAHGHIGWHFFVGFICCSCAITMITGACDRGWRSQGFALGVYCRASGKANHHGS